MSSLLSRQAHYLTDAAGVGNGEYFKYYMPGVGTPFPEVGDLNYSALGLATAAFGEERINWGLMMIIDALRRTLALPRLDDASLQAAVRRDIALYREEDGVMVAGAETPLFADPALVAQQPGMTDERRAEAHKAIDELWQAYYAKAKELKDAQV